MSSEDTSKPPFDFSKPRVEKYVTKVFYSCGCVAGAEGNTLWACMHHRLPPPEYDESLLARMWQEAAKYRRKDGEAYEKYLAGETRTHHLAAFTTASLLEEAARLITTLTENR